MSETRISVTSDKAFERAKTLLSEVPGGVETAMMRALNRAADMSKTQIVREVRDRYTVKAGDVRETMKVERATRSNLKAEVVSKGPALGLSHYKHSPKTDTTGTNRRQVRVAVKREGGLKPLGKAFVWQGKIMEREGKTRLPIQKLVGPAIPVVIGNEDIVDTITKTNEENVVKRLDHEVNRILKV